MSIRQKIDEPVVDLDSVWSLDIASSTFDLRSISTPYCPTVPLSTRRKCVWELSKGALVVSSGVVRYLAGCWPRPLYTILNIQNICRTISQLCVHDLIYSFERKLNKSTRLYVQCIMYLRCDVSCSIYDSPCCNTNNIDITWWTTTNLHLTHSFTDMFHNSCVCTTLTNISYIRF